MPGLRSTQPTPGTGGGFARQTSCGEFIRNYLLTEGERPIVDICNAYKAQLREDQIETQAGVLADKEYRKLEKKGTTPLPSTESLEVKQIAKLKAKYPSSRRYGPTYNSFATYFSKLKLLGWVAPTKLPPNPDENYSKAQERMGESPVDEEGNKTRREAFPRTMYDITPLGKSIDPAIWRNPMIARHPEYQNKTEKYKK